MSKKIKRILIIVGIIIVAVVMFLIFKPAKQPVYTTSQTMRQDLKQTVEATGTVKSAEDIALNFRTTGRIAKLNVKEGDTVKTGQILASLENAALLSQVLNAKSQLEAAQADLEKVLAGASASDITVSQKMLEQKQQDLLSSKNNFDNLQILRDTEINNLKSSTLVSLNNELAVAQSALDVIDSILKNSDAVGTLGVLNGAVLEDMKNNQILAQGMTDSQLLVVGGLSLDSSAETFNSGLSGVSTALDKVALALDSTLSTLQNTVTSANLSLTELETLKTSVKTEQTKVNSSRVSISSVKTNLSNKISYYADQLTQAENQIKAAETALAVAQAQLDLKKNPPRTFEIKAVESRVRQAEAGVLLAQAQLNDSLIIAPIDGILTKVNNKIGEQVGLSGSVMQMIGKSPFEIEVNIPEADISKVILGQTTDITLDAFGDNTFFAGTVSFIDPAETKIQDVVYYKVKIIFNSQCPTKAGSDGVVATSTTECVETIKSGMTANATIVTNFKGNVLAVPTRAIKSKNGDKVVEVLENKKVVEKNITTGLRGDDGTEIISGLVEGEEVITFQ
ncbi:MAG TPA: efflux RND transporter periplasmic adaptor subunit [bacterium]|nr:efflux RND transporter periplasmic adaptor subunit [bacterium]